MKKLICIILTFLSTPVFACTFGVMDSPDVREAVNQRGGYPLSDEKCALLNKNNMSLRITAQASVLNGINVGAAAVFVTKNGVTSDNKGFSTTVNSGGVGSQDVADTQMYESIREGIRVLDFEKAIKEVQAHTAKLKR